MSELTVSAQMNMILNDYSEEVQRVANSAITTVARECVKKLKANSPKKTGSYARGWAVKKLGVHGDIVDVVIHNKTDYQLTHLLENGHRIVNKKGEWGRVNGIKHIAPVNEWGSKELPAEIERRLS